MDLTKYQVFLKTVECGSFTAAAQQLSFTQSGVSHAISGLEEELGVTLLSRSRGGVHQRVGAVDALHSEKLSGAVSQH